MKKVIEFCKFVGRHYVFGIIIGALISVLGLLCIPFSEGTRWMPLGKLLMDHPNVTVGIVLILVGLAMPILAFRCRYGKQKWTYISLDALIVADGVLAITNIIGPNPVFAFAFLVISVELFGYAFFKNPEEPKAAIDILEAGITAILLLIVVICNMCGKFTFNHPVALPRTLGILIILLGAFVIGVSLYFRLPHGSVERAIYEREKNLKMIEKNRRMEQEDDSDVQD